MNKKIISGTIQIIIGIICFISLYHLWTNYFPQSWSEASFYIGLAIIFIITFSNGIITLDDEYTKYKYDKEKCYAEQ